MCCGVIGVLFAPCYSLDSVKVCVDEEGLKQLARGHGGYNPRMKRVSELR